MVSLFDGTQKYALEILLSQDQELFFSVPISLNSSVLTLEIGLKTEEVLDTKLIRRLGAATGKEILQLQSSSALINIDLILASLGEENFYPFVEGLLLSQYERQNWKSHNSITLPDIFLTFGDMSKTKAEQILNQTKNLVDSTLLARDLVNRPANMLTPAIMAEEMCKAANQVGISTEILNFEEIQNNKMGGLIAVGGSSNNPPRLTVLRYLGDPTSSEIIGLVGKGVTLDTGGYCLKPSSSIGGIRGDMAGAAAVFGTILTLAKNKIPTNVTVVIPAAENRISPDSFIPGDVLYSMSGKTIEVGNTDAEGRLILADAMTYAIRKEHVTRVLDIATLTGAVVSMFGFTTAGVLSNNDEYYAHLEKAAELSGEQYWRLPIFSEYKKLNNSTVADLYNAPKSCGTIAAGLFIGDFAEELPWIHIDIAGTAWVDTPEWEFQTQGATGAAVSTLYYLCEEYAN